MKTMTTKTITTGGRIYVHSWNLEVKTMNFLNYSELKYVGIGYHRNFN
jgi:hypothetical protein